MSKWIGANRSLLTIQCAKEQWDRERADSLVGCGVFPKEYRTSCQKRFATVCYPRENSESTTDLRLARVDCCGWTINRDPPIWREFCALYEPAVIRLARNRGLRFAAALQQANSFADRIISCGPVRRPFADLPVEISVAIPAGACYFCQLFCAAAALSLANLTTNPLGSVSSRP